jgi:CRISPR-associated protein Cas1
MGRQSKVVNLLVDTFGNYLGMDRGCVVLRDKERNEKKYPLFESEIGEVVLTSGNTVSTQALSALGFWGIDVLIATRNGRPIAMLKTLNDDSHVKTRLCQYDAFRDGRAFEIAKQFVKSKIEGQNIVLKKHGLKSDTSVKLRVNALETDNLALLRRRLTQIEAKFSRFYFKQIFGLIPEKIRPKNRRTYRAYDGVNNLFNLGYELLQWKVHSALINAKLEPYLGFLHSEQFGKPSLVCDFQELYRYLIDDFVIQYCEGLVKRNFTFKTEKMSARKIGKREYLNDTKTKDFTSKLRTYFETQVGIPRIKVGKKQKIETLINEEALLFTKYLRTERKDWLPRVGIVL